MIQLMTGNILEADAEALVNTVNCVGVMGKGIALQFRQAYPDNYEFYRKACEQNLVRPGAMLIYESGRMLNPRYIVNFPTKRHWKGKSKMEDIEAGLVALVEEVKKRGINSIAIPPLGVGNGGLNWSEVRPRIEAAFASLTDIQVLLYEPHGAPAADTMKIATTRPKMTPGRAVILLLFENYAGPMYRLTMLEAQKLAYLAQAAGEPLKLEFVKGKYGPYSETLHHVLQRMEGHFIRGYGDRSQDESIRILPGATDEARDFLQQNPETKQRLERVSDLIEGFETPYGMELLATIHWVANENPSARHDPAEAIKEVHQWSPLKKMRFQPPHIQITWTRLRDHGWL